MKSSFLAVDLGATSGRTVLATFDGQRIEMREFTRFENPEDNRLGHRKQGTGDDNGGEILGSRVNGDQPDMSQSPFGSGDNGPVPF